MIFALLSDKSGSYFSANVTAEEFAMSGVVNEGKVRGVTRSRRVGPSLLDIAGAAGLSQMTVSNVLRGRGGASVDTQRRVLRIAKQLGYRPNLAARATATGRFNCVSMLFSTEDRRSAASRQLLSGVTDVLSSAGVHLAVSVAADSKLSDEAFVPQILESSMSDGLLINYTDHIPAGMREIIERHRIPSIWINSRQVARCVRPDDYDAAYRLTRHMLSRGHRRIAYVDLVNVYGFAEPHYSAADRQAGYAAALADAGLAPRLVVRRALTESTEQMCVGLLSDDPPSAVITYGPTELLPLTYAAAVTGRRLVDQLSFATFAGSRITVLDRDVTVALAPDEQVGRHAAQAILKEIETPGSSSDPIVVPFSFNEGQTVALHCENP
jgi:DNA-binding LacI/PurR family transcriptional regulator